MRRFQAALLVLAASSAIVAGCTILDRLSQDSDPIVEDASIDGAANEAGPDSGSAETSVGNDAATVDAATGDGGVDGSEAGSSDAAGADTGSNDAQADGDTG